MDQTILDDGQSHDSETRLPVESIVATSRLAIAMAAIRVLARPFGKSRARRKWQSGKRIAGAIYLFHDASVPVTTTRRTEKARRMSCEICLEYKRRIRSQSGMVIGVNRED